MRITMLTISALGGLIFIIGTYVFMQVPSRPSWGYPGAWLFTIGSIFFLIPGLWVIKLYFFSDPNNELKQELLSEVQI